jgi:hypothetical protein
MVVGGGWGIERAVASSIQARMSVRHASSPGPNKAVMLASESTDDGPSFPGRVEPEGAWEDELDAPASDSVWRVKPWVGIRVKARCSSAFLMQPVSVHKSNSE